MHAEARERTRNTGRCEKAASPSGGLQCAAGDGGASLDDDRRDWHQAKVCHVNCVYFLTICSVDERIRRAVPCRVRRLRFASHCCFCSRFRFSCRLARPGRKSFVRVVSSANVPFLLQLISLHGGCWEGRLRSFEQVCERQTFFQFCEELMLPAAATESDVFDSSTCYFTFSFNRWS
jgi:hypothetical protein